MVAPPLPEAVALSLWRVTLSWRHAVKEALRPFQLTLAQYLVLESLVRLSAEDATLPSQRRLADDAGLDKMSISHAVRALEARGLADRGVDGVDGRSWRVMATPGGAELLEQVAPLVAACSRDFLSPLGQDVAGFAEALQQLTS